MSKKFSEQEKEFITLRLKQECEIMWGQFGYKKSNIDELCRKVGISKGAFYLFFESKEQLFIETYKYRMHKHYELAKKEMEKSPNNDGFYNAIMAIYPENTQGRWLENLNGPEYQLLLARMPKNTDDELMSYAQVLYDDIIEKYQLKFKIDPALFIKAIHAISNAALHEDELGNDIDTIVEILLSALFKQYAL